MLETNPRTVLSIDKQYKETNGEKKDESKSENETNEASKLPELGNTRAYWHSLRQTGYKTKSRSQAARPCAI